MSLIKNQISQINHSTISLDTPSVAILSKSNSSFGNVSDPNNKTKRHSSNTSYFLPSFDSIPTTCFICNIIFDNLIKLECHQLLYRHIAKPGTKFEPQKEWIDCRKCKMSLLFSDQNITHKCHKKLEDEINDLHYNLSGIGIPLYCILCDSKPVFSRGELIVHIICFHSLNKLSKKCSVCNCQFKTESIYTKTEHTKNEHLGEMEINFLKLTRLFDAKLITVKGFQNPMTCIYKTGKLTICGQSFDNLAHFTLHILLEHCRKYDQKPSYNKRKSNKIEEVECNLCDLMFPNKSNMEIHILEYHQIIFENHLIYLKSNDGFEFQYNPMSTCVLCMKYFPNQISKDVHTYVTHWSKSWPQCGLCLANIIDENYHDFPDNLQYKTLQIHERFHIEAVTNFINLKAENPNLVKDFDFSLFPKPKLYIKEYIPIKIKEQKELEKNRRKRVFPKHIKMRLMELGYKNRKVQEDLEIYGDHFQKK